MKKIITTIATAILGIHMLISNIPVFSAVSAESLVDSLTAKSVVVADAGSGEILISKEETKKLPIASMVKLMTVLLTMESVDDGTLSLDQKICVSKNAAGMGGSQAFLDAGSEYTVEQLLKSAIIASANDASVALAETIAGNEQSFVEKMNARANELSMTMTHYSNATGLPAVDGYSCAKDVAILLRQVLSHDLYFKYSTIWMEDLVHPSGRITGLTNTNKLIRYYAGCDAGKTGSTKEAGYCIASSAKKNDLRIISVVIGAESGAKRFSESASLLDWAFANYENKTIFEKGQKLDPVKISKAKVKQITPIVSEKYSCVTKRGEQSEITTKIEINQNISAPLKAGDEVGTAYVMKDGVVVKEIKITIDQDVKKTTIFDAIKQIIA